MLNVCLRGFLVCVPAMLLCGFVACKPRSSAPPAPGGKPVAATQSSTAPVSRPADAPGWRKLEDGLELGVFELLRKSSAGDSRVTILRIDPRYFTFRLMNASAPDQGKALSAKGWCDRAGLVAAVNASMFQTDGMKSVAFMKSGGHVNNGVANRDNAVLCFDPVSVAPKVQIADLENRRLADLQTQYGTLVQSIRMVSPAGANVWSQQPREWSTCAVGQDRHGRILFIHCRSPYSVHDLIDMLLALPIELKAAMYTEGGPEAQLFIRSGKFEMEAVGSYETGFMENDSNARAWPVPNVIGIVRERKPEKNS